MIRRPPHKLGVYAPGRQCPNCHQERVATTIRYYNRKTGAYIHRDFVTPVFWGMITGGSILVIVYLLIPILFKVDIAANPQCTFGPILLGAAVMIALIIEQSTQLKDAIQVNEYGCANCGHEWKMKDGKPIPDA